MKKRYVIFEELIDSLYSTVKLLSNYYSTPRQYGTQHKIRVAEAHIINRIGKSDNVTAKIISDKTNRTKAAVSQMLEKLELKGLIYRITDPKDSRRKLLRLTEAGKIVYEFHEKLDTAEYTSILNILSQYNEDDLQTFITMNNDIRNAIAKTIDYM